MRELWRRWWPERVCVEFLGDKIQAGYDALERREAAGATGIWLEAWVDVVRLCDLTGIASIREFDERFPMYQSLLNWSQDLEDALWNAGREDPGFLRRRIAVCEEALRRFPNENELMVENRRRAAAESYFELGETDKGEGLFGQWLEADPGWGWGWIGWADLHFFANNRPKDYSRAEATRTSREASGVRVRRTIDLKDAGDRAVVPDTTTATFEGEGFPLGRMMEIVDALDAATPSAAPRRATKVGRNAALRSELPLQSP